MPTEPVLLTLSGREVARYLDGADLDADLSPRPYLHPVRTPGGVVVTETRPEDHHHHHGVSAAVVDIDGTSYWGGKSYVDGQGYVMLPNQGRQVGEAPQLSTTPDRSVLTQRLRWSAPDGTEQVVEDREIRLAAGPGPAHLLTWRSGLHAQRDLTIGSPATRGRTGAGYGGLFWRLGPESGATVRVRTAGGVVRGEQDALGAIGPWLTLTTRHDGGTATVLLAQPDTDLLPWFVRVTGYTGAGPAVAWDRTATVAAGDRRDLHLWAALVDGDLADDDADRLYRDLEDLAA